MRLSSALLIAGCIGFFVGMLVSIGAEPVTVISGIFEGAFGSQMAINDTLEAFIPLVIAGLAVFIGLRAGLFNIGVEGQLLAGALISAVIALAIPGPIGIVLAIIAGMFAGLLIAAPAGLIKAHRGGHEVITTIMMNNIVILVTGALVAGPLKDPERQNATTPLLAESSRIPTLQIGSDLQISYMIFVAIALTFLSAWWLRRTVAGYELRAVGENPKAAQFAGAKPKKVIVLAMCGSGALAGLAGTTMVLGLEGRFFVGFSPGYGFDALGIGLLAGPSAWLLLPASLLFAALGTGTTFIQILGVPKGIGSVVVGLIIIVVSVLRYRTGRTDGT
jgi:simple sugar transport system permease protein